MDFEPFGYAGQSTTEMRDALHLRVDKERFAQKNVRTFEGATILSVGGRDDRLGNDFVLDVKLANGQRIQGVIDQGRHSDSSKAFAAIHSKTNVFREDKNSPVAAAIEGTFASVPNRTSGAQEWVLRIAQIDAVLPDGTAVKVGRPIHAATHDTTSPPTKEAIQTQASSRRSGGFSMD